MMESSTIHKFDDDLKYIRHIRKKAENYVHTKLSSSHITDNASNANFSNNKPKGTSNLSNSSNLDSTNDDESESKIVDLCNSTLKTSTSDHGNNKNENSTSVSAYPRLFDTFSTTMKDASKKDFVNTCLLINKAKKTAKEADLYLRKINEQFLPKFRSADITSDIGQRNIDIPLQISLRPLSSFKEQLSFKGINKNNEKPKTVTKPKSPYQEKLFENSCNANNSQQLKSSSEPLKSIKDYANNVGIVNFIANSVNEKDNSDCHIKNLAVQKIPSVNVKPDLVTQKVTNIQIKPDSKKTLSNKYKPNVAYHEVMFDVQPEICTCQSPLPKNTKNNTVTRYEIRRILCGMLNDILSNNDSLSDPLVHKLQKIMINLEETDLMENKDSNEVKNLIEEHSIDGFSETVIKNRLFKIAENDYDEKSFEQMALEMENFYRQMDNRLTNIKNFYLARNPLMIFPVILGDNILAGVSNSINEKPGNNCLNDTYQPKNFHDIRSSNTISVKDFLYLSSNNFASSKMPDQISNLEEPGSEIKINGSSEDMIQGESYNNSNINTVSFRKNTNEIVLLKSQLSKFEDDNCLKNNNIEEHTLINNQIQDSENFQLKKQKCHLNSAFSKLSPTNTEHTDIACTDHFYKETGDSFTSMIPLKQTTQEIESGTENSISFEVVDHICGLHNVESKTSIGDIFNFSKNNSDVEHTLMNNQIFSSIKQECHINAVLSKSSPSNNNLEYTDNACPNHLYKETGESSTSMMSSKQTIQEIESDTESSINFEEGDHICGLHKVDSKTSIGEIFL
ncbi:Hypothetical protein CINCED_3A019814 [Cinara cedri]|uniref:Uncharacterized protein n=1 Tax=Cinara cedri TaxID=506608 RepID=A0A5E4NII7_9HEMI|nr:Hypothetical protein CINCED_3A019814 [Cinara cedri]